MTDFYRRKLPHWQPEGVMYFITFRLANSLPLHVIQELKEWRERERKAIHVKFSGAQLRDELYKLDKFKPAHIGVTAPYPLTDTLKLLKGRTARRCNQALGRDGKFWHHESYDYVIRDQGEYERIVWYVMNNPVKAGLVENWEDWKFTYVSRM